MTPLIQIVRDLGLERLFTEPYPILPDFRIIYKATEPLSGHTISGHPFMYPMGGIFRLDCLEAHVLQDVCFEPLEGATGTSFDWTQYPV